MKVLLIGGTGTLSTDTTRLCINRGFDVFLFNRGHKNSMKANNLNYIIGDINNVIEAKAVLGDIKFDVVVDYLTYNFETLKKRIEVFSEKTEQYIFISSATVYPIQEGLITEKCEPGNDGWLYSKNKRLCEEYLRNTKLPFQYTIVRPYITYGDRRIPFPIISKKSCWNLIYRVENNMPVLMCGDGNQKLTLTHTRDFAVGIVGLFLNNKAYGEDFNIVGNNVYTWNDVIEIIEKQIEKKADLIYVPTEVLSKEITSFREELLYDKAFSHIFDNSKLVMVVPEFESKIDLNTGLGETIRTLIKDDKMHNVDERWNAMEDVLCRKHGANVMNIGFKKRWIYFKSENRTFVGLKHMVRTIIRH